MGAHMYAAMHRMPDTQPGESTKDAYRREIAATSDRDKVIAATLPGVFLDWPEDLEVPFDPDFGPDDISAAEIDALAANPRVMDFIEARLATAVDSVVSRESTTWRLFGIDVAITGGMSFGDSPTEAFDSHVLLGALPAFEIPLEAPSPCPGA